MHDVEAVNQAISRRNGLLQEMQEMYISIEEKNLKYKKENIVK
jgi:hypothetical protein